MRIACLAGVAIITLVAWTWPVERGAAPANEGVSCQFEIKASNNLSFDVWVDLYDSKVTVAGLGSLFRDKVQLKIQNHRIRSGESMNRRFTAPGRCSAVRNWYIKARRGGLQRTIFYSTVGTRSTSRTVNLGPSSKWEWYQ